MTKISRHSRGKRRRKNKAMNRILEIDTETNKERRANKPPPSSFFGDLDKLDLVLDDTNKPQAKFPWLGIVLGAIVWAAIIVLVIWLVG